MNATLKKILQSREDISDYVFHFTKSSTAKDNLKQIILDNEIRDINGNGYICLSESPVTMLPQMFEIFEKYENPMYAPYGIGIKKDYLYSKGARPVIYGDEKDYELVPEELKWRFVSYTPGTCDYTWLREWRINVPSFELDSDNCIVVVKSLSELDPDDIELFDLDDVKIDAEPEDGGFTVFYSGVFKRKFKVISIDQINSVNKMSKKDLHQILSQQHDFEERPLGSEWR